MTTTALLDYRESAESPRVFWYHTDQLGTPQALTDERGSIVWQARYSPFGEAEMLVAEITQPLRFPGQYYDEETGLHYNYFRYYDPALGRYLRSDPIGLDGGVNTYAYVDGNPIYYIDPYGLLNFKWHGNWGGPGRVNGQNYRNPSHPNRPSTGWRESDDFPRHGDEGFVPPRDPRDQAYYGHDTCISDCERNKEGCDDAVSTSECIAKCDIELSKNPNIPLFEQIFFDWYSGQR